MKEHNALTYILTERDIFLSPVYFALLFALVIWWRKTYCRNQPGAEYLIPAFIAKMVCCVAMACLIHFYYGYGDTFNYYTGAVEIRDAFRDNPYYAFELIFKPGIECSPEALRHFNYLSPAAFDISNANNMIRIAGVASILGMGTYIPMAFLLGMLALVGVWSIYKVFYYEFPQYYHRIAIVCLFAPSAMLWSSGVIKDTVCLFALGICFGAAYNIFKGRHYLRSIAAFTAGTLLLLLLKDYLFFTFLAALAVVFVYFKLLNHKNQLFRYIFRALMVVGLIAFVIWYIDNSAYISENVFDVFQKKTEVLQNVTTQVNEAEGGAGYTISNVDDTSPLGVLRSTGISMATTFFRPFLWESRSPIMFFNALESFAVLLLTAYLLVRTRVKGFFTFAFSNPVLLFSFVYFLLLGALVGFVSFNFGTLVRYKMPLVPLFYTYLILLFQKLKHGHQPAPQRAAVSG